MIIVLAVLAILIVRQPDLGTAAVIVSVGAVQLYAGGVPWRKVATLGAVFGGLGAMFLAIEPYGRARLTGFINPFGHASTTGYQVVQSLVTLGSGHLLGSGLGGSPSAWGFLPNASTDFVFAIIGNNFGFVGGIGVLCGIIALGWLGIRIASRAEDRYRGARCGGDHSLDRRPGVDQHRRGGRRAARNRDPAAVPVCGRLVARRPAGGVRDPRADRPSPRRTDPLGPPSSTGPAVARRDGE